MFNTNPRTLQPYKKGEKRNNPSVKRLKKLDFNPIDELVALHIRLIKEENYWSDIRDGKIIVLGEDGKPKRNVYKAMIHNNVFSQLQKVSADLLQYRYHKVLPPEDSGRNKDIPEFHVHLTD